MKITLKPHSCITMIGASHSGKSTTAKQIKAYVETIGKTCKIISSDELRKEMLFLENSQDIQTQPGFAISELVFKKLRSEMHYYMSYPCNTDVVIVDTTGLDRTFREDICRIAVNHTYANVALLFNLNRTTLESRLKEGTDTFYIGKQVKRMRESVLPNFNKHDYLATYRILDKHVTESGNDFEYEFVDTTKVIQISEAVKTAIYGDVHQQINELKALYEIAKSKGVTDHILIGDYLDKGDEASMKETIKFVYDECTSGNMKLIRANHEEYVFRHLIDLKYFYEENEETQYFTSLKFLMDPKNEEYKNMFFDLMDEHTYDYAFLKNEHNFLYATHSPCEEKYLGKHSPKALKMSRNTRFFKEVDGVKLKAIESLGDILKEASSNKPQHIFGHVEVGSAFHVYKNKIAIDTGCVSGGDLTAIIVDPSTNKREFISVKSGIVPNEPLLDFSIHIKQWTNRAELDQTQEKKVRRLVKADPAFISGTVAPAPSTTTPELSIESLQAAIDLFIERGITKVYAQKKHMGSRCQVYLFPERENCYAVSRNGFKIHRPEIDPIIDKEFEKYKGKFETQLITDNELMPWSFLGKGLINETFMPYYKAVNSDMQALNGSGLNQFMDNGPELQKNLQLFNKQVLIYATDVEGYLETFGVIYKDGKELLTVNQKDVLTEFGIEFHEFDLEKEEDVAKLIEFNATVIADGTIEGIVLKPIQWNKGDIPCMKIRNTEYLRIVYGFDYTSSLQQHVNGKNIKNKLNLSIKEQNLNLLLIDAYSRGDKELQKEIYSTLVVEFDKEAGLDPRL